MNMFTIIGITLGGIACGALLRKRRLRGVQRITTALIWLLLFLLGAEVGGDNLIVESLHTLGLESAIICLCSTMGSVIAAWILWRKI